MIPDLFSIIFSLSFCSNYLLLCNKVLQNLVVSNNNYFIISLGFCGVIIWGKSLLDGPRIFHLVCQLVAVAAGKLGV